MTRLVQIGLAGGLAWSPFNVYLLVTTVILFISETLHHHHCTRNQGQTYRLYIRGKIKMLTSNKIVMAVVWKRAILAPRVGGNSDHVGAN